MLRAKQVVSVGIIFWALVLFTSPAQAFGVSCSDPSIPGTWTAMNQCERSYDFGVIIYPEAITVFLTDHTIYVTEHPRSWDFFYGDFFIFEKPDLWDLIEDEEECTDVMRDLLEEDEDDEKEERERIEILPPVRPRRPPPRVMVAWR